MSATTQIVTTIASFAVTGTGGIAAFVKQAKAAEAKINTLVVRYEALLNSVLNEVTKLEATVAQAIPAPAVKPAAKTAPAKAPVAKKPARRAGK